MFDFEEEEHCSNTMCAFLPLGFVLMSMDIYHDLSWCLFPSTKTRQALMDYYTHLLTPKLYPIPYYPGYLFPVYATFVFIYQCPNIYNWYTFLLYIPLAYRYQCILGRPQHANTTQLLHYWWIVVVIRILLTIVTLLNFSSRNCLWSQYGNYVKTVYKTSILMNQQYSQASIGGGEY